VGFVITKAYMPNAGIVTVYRYVYDGIQKVLLCEL